jgi:hypothetical protein
MSGLLDFSRYGTETASVGIQALVIGICLLQYTLPVPVSGATTGPNAKLNWQKIRNIIDVSTTSALQLLPPLTALVSRGSQAGNYFSVGVGIWLVGVGVTALAPPVNISVHTRAQNATAKLGSSLTTLGAAYMVGAFVCFAKNAKRV